MMMLKTLRTLTEYERSLLAKLLAADFAGRDAVAIQIARSSVAEIDENSSLEFHVGTDVCAHVKTRVPVSAEASDRDGVPVSVLLHVVDGKVKELEIYKADGSPIEQMPAVDTFDVFAPV